MSNQIFLHSFQSVLPRFHSCQADLNDWIVSAHARSLHLDPQGLDKERLISVLPRFCTNQKVIGKRYYECGEMTDDWDAHQIYKMTEQEPAGADIGKRNRFFSDTTQRVFEEIYNGSEIPEHLIHVTCTGYVSPSPAQRFFSSKATAPSITHAYHMGCYASMPAVRIGVAMATRSTVDIVHTEMCSIHLATSNHTPEQMVVQSLFADGHIKYRLSTKSDGPAFRVLHIEEQLIQNSLEDMTWIPGPNGMEMTLSRNVPTKIQSGVRSFLDRLCDQAKLESREVLKNAVFAVHPGGPKIIDAVKETLELSEEQVMASRKILFERGNMSSATLPHVWQEILASERANQKIVISLAFGPGLTMFGGVFEITH